MIDRLQSSITRCNLIASLKRRSVGTSLAAGTVQSDRQRPTSFIRHGCQCLGEPVDELIDRDRGNSTIRGRAICSPTEEIKSPLLCNGT